jgi:hypothetical protein
MASEALQRLTGDSTLTVGWTDSAQGPYIVQGEAQATSCDDLIPAQADLLVTALQLSLVRCLNERAGHLPLVLTDQSMGLPPAILKRLATLLKELAETGQQVLVITVDPMVSQQFRQLDVPSLVVMRQESFLTRPAIDHSAVAGQRRDG